MSRRWSLALVVVAWTARAAAADPEPVRITYGAPDGCPSEDEFVARLDREAHARRVDRGAVRTFAFAIARDPAGFRGSLAVDGAAREVSAATCGEVASALVLVAALAIEERAPAPTPPPAPVPAPAPPAPAPSHEVTRLRLAVGAGVARYSGMTPSARLGVPVSVVAWYGRRELRATFDATTSDDTAMASFRWTAGRLEICPYVVALGHTELAPYAGVQLGALTGRGTGIDQAATETRPWIAPEAGLRARQWLGSVALEVEATAAAPLVRDRYYIAPMSTIHEVPAVAWGVAAGLVVEFW